jgi:isoleucyl-tRNA synthetase
MSYKDTLNLPRTDFPMKANLTSLEPKILSKWEELKIYETLRDQRKGSEKFILHDGPPYANGLIHIGHALNKLLKDIIIKYKFMQGYDCPYIIGWDCHGLPVEHQLFKKLKKTKHDVEVVDFRKKAKDYALKFVGLQTEDFKHLGVFSDWNNPYLTLNPQYENGVLRLLGYLAQEGYIYRGRKPVNWCASCETALAEAEVEYADKESDSTYLTFKLIENQGLFSDCAEEISFLVWTTTPWTLISNVAVAVSPDLIYCLGDLEGRKVVFAKELKGVLEDRFEKQIKIDREFQGKDLENLELKHPFFDRKAKVLLADFVSHEEGSGCVHIAPGHGEEDFSLTKKYDLDILMPVNDKGVFESSDEFKGKRIKQASSLALEKLKENNALIKHQTITHSYPHCWRCKKPIIFRATFQWFLKIDHKGLREKLLAETENIRWTPPSGKERMKGMLTLRPDWCLSRQRLWGVPIPAVKCKACGEVILSPEVIANCANIFAEKGSDSWFDRDLSDFLPKDFKCSQCSEKEFEKEFDILDVWFESGASFMAVVQNHSELRFPADLYLEGSDQHRGWFQVSLIPSVAKEQKAPYKGILTHGFVVDSEGRKMSKSLGNVIAPQNITKQYGSEILRFWAAYTDYSEDVKISEDIIKQLVDMYRKIRNTIKFTMGNICDFSPETCDIKYEDLWEVDRYMLAKAMVTCKDVISCYEEFSFYRVCQKVFNFCNLDLSSFYLDILKDRLYTFSRNSTGRRSAQFVLYHILRVLLKLIAPILSFTAEEAYAAWSSLSDKKDSIFAAELAEDIHQEWIDEALLEKWGKIFSLRGQVLKEIENQRGQGIVGSSLEAVITLELNDKDFEFYQNLRDTLREIFIVSEVELKKGKEAILVEKAKSEKCPRCWNFRESVGKDTQHPDVCDRCAQALRETSV